MSDSAYFVLYLCGVGILYLLWLAAKGDDDGS